MPYQGGSSRVSQPAYVARVNVTHVCQNMLHLIRPFLKGFLTDRANVGIDLAVDGHMFVQLVLREKSLSARCADITVHVSRALVPS